MTSLDRVLHLSSRTRTSLIRCVAWNRRQPHLIPHLCSQDLKPLPPALHNYSHNVFSCKYDYNSHQCCPPVRYDVFPHSALPFNRLDIITLQWSTGPFLAKCSFWCQWLLLISVESSITTITQLVSSMFRTVEFPDVFGYLQYYMSSVYTHRSWCRAFKFDTTTP